METQGKYISKDEFIRLCSQITEYGDPLNGGVKISYDTLNAIKREIKSFALDDETIDILMKHGKSAELIQYLNLVVSLMANMINTSPAAMQDYMDILNAAKPIMISKRASNELCFFGPRIPMHEARCSNSSIDRNDGGVKSNGTATKSK